ncbi:3721_t:CDS:2 [Acaulospora colombiana]|uniref:3721_t:CDS:1 n=1 Tax=Acaulospora colombiana TaxID=27376 RepID=A0ACA9LG30_9GLOM|nr:3721_t:CDS:2 [Acaulospora colombiana]
MSSHEEKVADDIQQEFLASGETNKSAADETHLKSSKSGVTFEAAGKVTDGDDDTQPKSSKPEIESLRVSCCSWISSLMVTVVTKGGVYLLLIFVLLSIIMAHFEINQLVLFIVSFFAIIPLSNVLTTGLNDLTTRVGPAFLSVLHAFSGNFVELVIEFYALIDGRYAIVRSAILGAILCNITLVLGVTFLAGSWPTQNRINTGVLRRRQESRIVTGTPQSGTFRVQDSSFETKLFVNTSASILALAVLGLVIPTAFKIAATPQSILTSDSIVVNAKEFEYKAPLYRWYFDVILIVASIAGITVCARYLVSTVEHIAEEFQLGTGFVGIVLFPLCVVSNFIEHYEAIKHAFDDKVDTAVGLILNTSVQMALLVAPILIILGWILGKPLTLDFNVLELTALACAVLIVNYLVADNRATWLEGYMLIVSYLLLAVAFFYFPTTVETESNVYCNPFSRNLHPKNDSPTTTTAA